MPAAQLLQLVKDGDLSGFETRCLEALTAGELNLAELVTPFRQLEKGASDGPRVATLGQMVLENADPSSDPAAALTIARIALLADPNNETLRKRLVELYRAVHGGKPGFDALLEASGLVAGRPARNAIRLLELCLGLKAGDTLISRTEDVVVEVIEIDAPRGLITVRRDGRPRTLTAVELAREYERVDTDDFRVLRQLRPERLRELLQNDPAAVIVNLLRTHGRMLDQDQLKAELTPKFLDTASWAKWWTNVRALLKRDPHVVVEGRSPVILRYTPDAISLEDETWTSFLAAGEPDKQLAVVEAYLREKKKDKQPPSADFLQRCHTHLLNYIKSIKERRPAEALACALVTERLDQEAGQKDDEAHALAVAMLQQAANPAALIASLPDASLWDLGLSALEAARPQDAPARAAELVPAAPAGLLDRLASMSQAGGMSAIVQSHIDTAMANPADNAEILYWLWKGPSKVGDLKLPEANELFTQILRTLSAIGRTLNVSAQKGKDFRARMKAALQLKDFAKVRQCMQATPADRAITMKTQLQRLEGLGDNTPARIIDLLREVHPELWKVTTARIEPWEDPNVLWTTKNGLHKRTEERDHLVNVTMRENAKRIGEAAALGDLSENSEYKFALEERDMLRARLALMNNELSVAEAIDPAGVPTDRIGVGSKATLRDAATGQTQVMTFLGPFDGDLERGILNYKAPVAQKLMGLHVGEQASLVFEGKDTRLEVVAIENGLA